MRAEMRSTSWWIETVRNTPPAGAKTPVDAKSRLWLSMHRRSYSTATGQFGANPNSRPVPTTPPQRVSLAESNTAPVVVTVPRSLSSATAAPPFTYQRTLFQAYPTEALKLGNDPPMEFVAQAGGQQ